MSEIGYCAVVLPEQLFWQGYFIHDTPKIKSLAGSLTWAALDASVQAGATNPLAAALAAALVDGATKKHTVTIAAASLALVQNLRRNYFVVIGFPTGAGTTTEIVNLDVDSADAARRAINQLPQVTAIKERLLRDVRKRRH